MEVSICMTEEEEQLVNRYAKRHGISLAEAFKRALFEQEQMEEDEAEFKSLKGIAGKPLDIDEIRKERLRL